MAPGTGPEGSERRENHTLREVLDELIELVRDISDRRWEMSEAEIEYSQERLQWLADEVWRLAMEGR